MADSQSQTFNCTKCGAPQNYQGGSAPTIQCPYCDTTLIVPEALRTPAPNLSAFGALAPVLNVEPTFAAITTLVRSSPAPSPSNTPRPSPTPQFANVISEFGGKGTGTGKMSDARAIAVDNNGNIFVAEYLGGRVQIFDANGKFKTQCLMDAKLPTPSLAADRNGNLYVLQATTITKYNAATCEQIAVFKPALGESYEHLAIGADGALYATMTGN